MGSAWMSDDDEPTSDILKLHSAPTIFRRLSSVVGQEVGKRDLATLLAMHVQWFLNGKSDPAHSAPNALIIGPTGVGKTHAIQTAADALRIPLAIADATRLSTTGIGEESLDTVLVELLRASRRLIGSRAGDRESDEPPELEELVLARKGIVFLDEFDKLARHGNSQDDRAELVQRRLLQFIDGARVTLPPSHHVGEGEMVFDTAGLLFVVAGAFTDLLAKTGDRPHKVMRRLARHNHVIPQDLERYGFMKELVARIPVIIEFSALSEEDLAGILRTKQVDPSQFYVEYLASLGTTLKITDEARRWIAANAAELEVGARGLHQVLFPVLSLLSQDVENNREAPNTIVLDETLVSKLARRVEERRDVRAVNSP